MQPVAVYNMCDPVGMGQQLRAEYTGTGCVSSDVH